MSGKDAHLYGQRAHKISKRGVSSNSSSVAFSTALSSLLSKESSKSTAQAANGSTGGRARSSKAVTPKDNLFTLNSKASKRKAAAEAASRPEYATSDYHAALSADEWKKSKRKMEEKARLYAAMKRGDVEDEDERFAVDFDRKWAEAHPEGGDDEQLSEQDDSGSESEQELVEYVDALGRTRKGTRADAAREQRLQRASRGEHEKEARARPAMPANVIYGDAIQTEAFNPDAIIKDKMEELAAKRDRELTPPEDTHYDSRAEIRNRGTGFFTFSTDEAERKVQMENLEKDRKETERLRAERAANEKRKRDSRRAEIEERRKRIQQARAKAQADRFLKTLGTEMLQAEQDQSS